ncbi:MAG: PAS domain S-box protein, partial [Spongiibacteraceae bacterium]|nr:PAS domain S-box protein [Spongiibacteraceae bacterium]
MSPADLQHVLDLIPLPAFFCTLQGEVLIRNRDLLQWVGTSEPDGADWLDTLPEESRTQILAWLATGAAEPLESTANLEFRGDRRLVHVRMTKLAVPALRGAIGTFTDVTELTSQRESLQQMATVFASATEGVLITDARMNILNINAAFSNVTGYSLEDVAGQTPRILSSGRHSAAFYRDMWAAVNRDGYWRGEIWNRRKNGELYPEELSITALHDASGKVTHYVGVFSDLSMLHATQER